LPAGLGVFNAIPSWSVNRPCVYSFKRFADPALKSLAWTYVDTYHIVGLADARQRALDGGEPFDYDREVEGLRVLDRYTLQFRLAEPRPRFLEFLAASDIFGAVAREVIERYGTDAGAHPVGTGPFKLESWRRASQIVLVRNPRYRERFYDAEPAADDAEGQALLKRFAGRRLPMVDRVEVSVVEEAQPRWLSFLDGSFDVLEEVPPEFIDQAMPAGKLAPTLVKQHIQAYSQPRADGYYTVFNMADPVVGGYAPAQVALRRAIALGLDAQREVDLVAHGQGFVAQSPISPNTHDYDPAFRSAMSEHDPARANALLDVYGYVDRDGDGWRERPDGSVLRLQWSNETTQLARRRAEVWKRDMDAIGIAVDFGSGQWPENLRRARAGDFQIWQVGGMAASPDSMNSLLRYDSRQVGGQNMARFDRPEVDTILKQLEQLEDGPERAALYDRMRRQALAWMPYRFRYHTLVTDLARPAVIGYRRPAFWQDWWQFVDVDNAASSH